MNNYIKSELYRTLRNKSTYLFIIICSFMLVSSNVVLALCKLKENDFPYATTSFAFGNVSTSMQLVYILCIMVAIMIFSNEHGNHTLKNAVSYGISRETLFSGKFLVQVIFSIAAFTIIMGTYLISSYLLLEKTGDIDLEFLLRTCFACLPFFVFGLATTNCFAFMREGSSAIGASCGVMVIIPMIFGLLGMKFELFHHLSDLMPWNIMGNISYDDVTKKYLMIWRTTEGFGQCWAIGIIGAAVMLVIGFIVFRNKEIK